MIMKNTDKRNSINAAYIYNITGVEIIIFYIFRTCSVCTFYEQNMNNQPRYLDNQSFASYGHP